MATTEEKKPKEKPDEGEKRVGCAHYKRRAKFVVGFILFLFSEFVECSFLVENANFIRNHESMVNYVFIQWQ